MGVEEVLTGFVHGRISRAEFESLLKPYLTVNFDSAARSVEQKRPLDAEVSVRPADVRARLEAYLKGEISADALSEWASLILLVDAFSWPGQGFSAETPGERAWMVVQELSAPQVHGAISPALVREKLSRLSRPAG